MAADPLSFGEARARRWADCAELERQKAEAHPAPCATSSRELAERPSLDACDSCRQVHQEDLRQKEPSGSSKPPGYDG